MVRSASEQGTASTKTRAEVRGGGKKPYAQKGTGNARMGSKRTPLRPGGGVSFGPKVCGAAADASVPLSCTALRQFVTVEDKHAHGCAGEGVACPSACFPMHAAQGLEH